MNTPRYTTLPLATRPNKLRSEKTASKVKHDAVKDEHIILAEAVADSKSIQDRKIKAKKDKQRAMQREIKKYRTQKHHYETATDDWKRHEVSKEQHDKIWSRHEKEYNAEHQGIAHVSNFKDHAGTKHHIQDIRKEEGQIGRLKYSKRFVLSEHEKFMKKYGMPTFDSDAYQVPSEESKRGEERSKSVRYQGIHSPRVEAMQKSRYKEHAHRKFVQKLKKESESHDSTTVFTLFNNTNKFRADKKERNWETSIEHYLEKAGDRVKEIEAAQENSRLGQITRILTLMNEKHKEQNKFYEKYHKKGATKKVDK
jgi:hypothetical protein